MPDIVRHSLNYCCGYRKMSFNFEPQMYIFLLPLGGEGARRADEGETAHHAKRSTLFNGWGVRIAPHLQPLSAKKAEGSEGCVHQ